MGPKRKRGLRVKNERIEKKRQKKQGVHTSQILRLVARYLLNLRKSTEIPGSKNSSMWDYLKPKYFDNLVRASLMTACPLMDDEDNLKSPSNAIKLGYDLRRLINGKIGMSIMTNDTESQHDGDQLLKLMGIYWGTRVTKLARVLLEERKYYLDKTLPLPEDIASLNRHINEALSGLDYTSSSKENFRSIAEAVLAKLVVYNRRRTGEMQAVRVRDYIRRCKGVDGEHLLGTCTSFEKKLLESQEVMTVRGKVGRGVPVILPSETKHGLAYLTDSKVRADAGVDKSNDYVFASGEGTSTNLHTENADNLETMLQSMDGQETDFNSPEDVSEALDASHGFYNDLDENVQQKTSRKPAKNPCIM